GDELALGQRRLRLAPRRVPRARNPSRGVVDRVRVAAPATRGARVDEHERRIREPPGEGVRADRVVVAYPRHEGLRLDLLLAAAQGTGPRVDAADEHAAVVVPEMAEQPPQPLGAAERAVRDDEHAVADARARGRGREPLRRGQRMPARALDGPIGEVVVDVEERRPRNVTGEVELAAPTGRSELPAAVDESGAHALRAYTGIALRRTWGVERS